MTRSLLPLMWSGLLSVTSLCAACAATSSARAPSENSIVYPGNASYELRLTEALDTLSERICWDGARPRFLVSTHRDGLAAVRSAVMEDGLPLRRTEEALELVASSTARCVDLEIDLTHEAVRAQRRTSTEGVRGVWLETDAVLWFDEDRATRGDAIMTWKLPAPMTILTPWQAIDETRQLVSADDFDWKTVLAVGAIEHASLRVGETRVEIAALRGEQSWDGESVAQWLTTAIDAVSLPYGGIFPRREVFVFLVPVGASVDPVVFGVVTRGGAPTVSLFVDETAPASRLRGEWVAIHEFLHLCMPYVSSADAWLSEGVVTYLTEVIRGRAQLLQRERDLSDRVPLVLDGLTETEAQQLMALVTLALGLERGFKGAKRLGLSLRQSSAQLGELRAFMQVYWGGASIMMQLDAALRAHDARLSIEQLLRHWATLTSLPRRIWTARELLASEVGTAGVPADVRPLLIRALERVERGVELFETRHLRDAGLSLPGPTQPGYGIDDDPESGRRRASMFGVPTAAERDID